MLRNRYHDFGPTLAQEKLAIEGVSLSVETVRQLLIGEGLWQARRARRPVIHQLRDASQGRVGRANQTLQDRLTIELRLRGNSSIEAANAYLPEFIEHYNARFAVAPRSSESAHRPTAKRRGARSRAGAL